jgi:hypothetical protein
MVSLCQSGILREWLGSESKGYTPFIVQGNGEVKGQKPGLMIPG